MLVLLLLIPLFSFGQAPKLDPNKKTVCSASITTNLQVQAFKEHLIKMKEIDKYQFVELTDFKGIDSNKDSWFDEACGSGITCDVLFMTGHFAGGFFGNHEIDPGISAEKLRELSCTKTCENILRSPVEVYLFGCNTLAGKAEDGRTPEQYFQILRSHGIGVDEAISSVTMRYSAFGDSYKDMMSTTFHGQKMLYGYTAPAPASVRSTPPFKQYLAKMGSYEKHFDDAVQRKLTGVVQKVDQTFKNTLKLSADQCLSIGSDDLKLKRMCDLLYGTSNIESKMEVVLDLLQEDITKNLPLVNLFFMRNRQEIKTTKAFQDLQSNQVVKEQLVGAAMTATDLNLSLESLSTVHTLNLISEEEVRKILSDKIYKNLGSNTYKAELLKEACVSLPCDINDIKDKNFFNTNNIYNLPDTISSMSPEVEQLLVNSKHKHANEVMISLEHAGPIVQKKVESTVPLKTSAKDESYNDLSGFYTHHPASPKVIDYFISLAIDNEGKSYSSLQVFKYQKLSDESKQKLKAALPSVKDERYRKTLESLTN